jgi:hypothetical protein
MAPLVSPKDDHPSHGDFRSNIILLLYKESLSKHFLSLPYIKDLCRRNNFSRDTQLSQKEQECGKKSEKKF